MEYPDWLLGPTAGALIIAAGLAGVRLMGPAVTCCVVYTRFGHEPGSTPRQYE